MRLAYMAYKNYGVIETPSSAVYAYLNAKHRTYMYDGFRFPPIEGNFPLDWGISMHESLDHLIMSWKVARKHLVHLEWVIPWKINHSVYGRNWGYTRTPDHIVEKINEENRKFAFFYTTAEVRTVSSKHFIPYMREVLKLPKDLAIGVKCPSVDTSICQYVNSTLCKKSRTICSVSRLTPHKEMLEVAQGLALWNAPVTWDLIGEGPMLKQIEKVLEGTKINLVAHGRVDGVPKLDIMRNSLFLGGWNGVPPAEALLMGSYALCMDDIVIKEYYGDAITYYSSSEDLAEKLDYYWNRPSDCTQRAIEASGRIYNNELGINTAHQVSSYLLGLIDEYEKNDGKG